MGAAVHHITADDAGGQTFTVNVERNFQYKPHRDFLVCAHCDWSYGSLSFRQTFQDIAGEHLSDAHDADRALGHHRNASFRTLRWIALPLAAVFLIVLFTQL